MVQGGKDGLFSKAASKRPRLQEDAASQSSPPVRLGRNTDDEEISSSDESHGEACLQIAHVPDVSPQNSIVSLVTEHFPIAQADLKRAVGDDDTHRYMVLIYGGLSRRTIWGEKGHLRGYG